MEEQQEPDVNKVVSSNKSSFKIHKNIRYLTILLIVSLIVNLAFSFLLVNTYQDATEKNEKAEEYKLRYIKLNERARELVYPSPTLIPYGSDGKQISATDWNIKFICPEGVMCDIYGNNISIEDSTNNLNYSFGVYRLDTSSLNNPNYSSTIDWLNGLLKREPEAIGSNLDEFYGTKSHEGTDGLSFPLYRGVDLNSLDLVSVNNIPSLSANKPNQLLKMALVPHDEYVYVFTTSHIEGRIFDAMLLLLDTVEFSP